MGGSLTANSKKFVIEMYKRRLVDRVETRNIELKISNNLLNDFEKIIELVFKFELEWLKFKNKLQKKRKIKLKNDNLDRIKVLKKRFKYQNG